MYPGLKNLKQDTIKTCKAYYKTDTVDIRKSTLTIIISNDNILNKDLKKQNLINSCKPNASILKIELQNKSGEVFKTGNYKYDGSDMKPLNGLPKIELIGKPSLAVKAEAQSKTYNFEFSKDHSCQIIEIIGGYIYGSFYFKDSEGIISGQFKAKIIN